MIRRPLYALALAAAVSALASSPAGAATVNYSLVTLNVPITVDQMPLGSTATVTCQTPTVGAPTASSGLISVPVTTQNGFVVYHGPPLVVTIHTGSGLVSGALVGCSVFTMPAQPDMTKSTLSTFSVTLP